MSDQQRMEFLHRVQHLEMKHAAMINGYSARLLPDGMIVFKPDRVGSRISGRSLLLFVAAFVLFKAFLMASLGFGSYDERVARLQAGSPVEQAGALIMQTDPVSQMVARQIAPYLR